ncbi:hypothetical protein BDV38DRAFT_286466 [Aspergillus pseudotamarii]|uniref:Fungal-type protein kinase domain-containing protein n=2 Tax=Aspergillus subgen. Circumdati TaxID=2720871 RepID=A0A5N6SIX1_ASPPS|nr:uncharacterized protein BDV38DRAFT_286466 [Aspergillus pseudotamarii]XP_031934915.1 uncharacterized protein BDV37DRAFT_53145 [Aspergillus pseudonomiae]KAE8133847.1 hypothetical protein BDV38DRAFT_286466 [Aspergillus pseudotamarii]KAE8397596.1 hypothetical protein BDV37DRAFT_53145 [Aspergillus pseudonomiae]
MSQYARPDTSKARPIGGKLNTFRESFKATCEELGLTASLDAISQFDNEDLQNLVLDLVSALRAIPDMRKLPSANGRKYLLSDLLRLNAVISSDDFVVERFIPLLRAVLNQESEDHIWDSIYSTVRESTPPPKLVPFLNQTPFLHTTSSIVNSSEHRKHVDTVLKAELGSIFLDVPNFFETFFNSVNGHETACTTLLQRCKTGDNPLYCDGIGWCDWPADAQEKEVLKWISGKFDLVRSFVAEQNPSASLCRTVLAQPAQPLQGSTAARKLDIAIVSNSETIPGQIPHWSRILVPGELKSNPEADTVSKTWRDLGRYVREVFTTQDTRRFVLGFTLCGSIMRLWEFDRVGATASEPFDINKNGLKFISVVTGYLLLDNEQLGYDPTIMCSSDGTRTIEVIRHGQPERLILDELMKRSSCVAGRATTCWKAHRAGGEANIPLVVKDSWQYPVRDEEGVLLQKALEGGVTNVARYYSHQTVEVGGKIDDVLRNIRGELDLISAKHHRPACLRDEGITRNGRSIGSMAGRKRSSSRTGTEIPPPKKRTCSSSPSKDRGNCDEQNRVHRRVIIHDYGKPLYKASSLVAMLTAFDRCMVGYHSLYIKTGLLQGDISTGNLMMNEDDDNPSWPAFLIDLDLAVQERRDRPSGAWGKTGTRAFMPIGQLLGDKLSWVHGLESFFWVLFWICIHYEGPNEKSLVIREFDEWNYVSMEELAKLKLGTVSDDDIFESTMDKFTEYHKPLKPCVDELRKAVFPNGKIRRKGDESLLSQMREIVQKAQDALQEASL